MAKDNLFLGFARGSVGDVTFSRVHGQQVSRARNRAPRNPQSTWQLLQRVIMKTASGAYSFFQDLTNHSFQGFAEGMPCQSRFLQLAVDQQRYVFRDEINAHDEAGILESSEANYLSAGEIGCVIKEWQIAEGSLRPVRVEFPATGTHLPKIADLTESESNILTYQKVVNALDLQRGDQLTFVICTADDTFDSPVFGGMAYARVILEPADGNMDGPFTDINGEILQPNARNEGRIAVIPPEESGAPSFSLGYGMNIGGQIDTIMGAAIIVSRQVGGVYQRSDSKLVLAKDATLSFDHYTDYMADAIASFRSVGGSALYLNQAE